MRHALSDASDLPRPSYPFPNRAGAAADVSLQSTLGNRSRHICAGARRVVYSAAVKRGGFDVTPAVLLVWLGAATVAAQDLPLRTETALTAQSGTLVFETGFDLMADEPSYVTGLERNRWDGPLLRLVYSPSDNVELDLEWVTLVGVWDEPGREVQNSYWGDVSLRAKWRILAGRPGRPTLGARFALTLPETEYEDEEFRPLGLGPNTTRVAIEALLSHSRGRLRLDLNAGLLLFEEVFRAHEQRDFLSYGLALSWAARPSLTLLAEAAGRAGDGMPGADQSAEARVGLRLGRGRLRADAALRRGLSAADGSWGLSLGLTWTVQPRS